MPLQHLGHWSETLIFAAVTIPRYKIMRHCNRAWDIVYFLTAFTTPLFVGFAHLSSMPLRHLDLSICGQLTNADLFHIASLPLEYLNLAYCYRLTDAGLVHVSALPLNFFNIRYCSKISENGLARLAGILVKRMDLSYCPKTTRNRFETAIQDKATRNRFETAIQDNALKLPFRTISYATKFSTPIIYSIIYSKRAERMLLHQLIHNNPSGYLT
jgi:hypothetical protein